MVTTKVKNQNVLNEFDLLSKFNITKAKERGVLPSSFIAPFSILWEFTYNCELECIHCYNNSSPTRKNDYSKIGLPELKKVVNYIEDFRIPSICITGGDFLLHKNIWGILNDIVSTKVCTISGIVNGWAITPEIAKKIASNFYMVELSIDGATSETHDFIRGKKGSFDRAINALKLLSKLGVSVVIAFSAMKNNVNEFRRLVDKVIPLGASSVVSSNKLLPIGRAFNNPNINMSNDDFENLKQQVILSQKDYPNNRISISDNVTTWIDEIRQGLPNHRMMLTPDGTIKLMPFIPLTFGNLKSDNIDCVWKEKLSKIHNNRTFLNYMDKILYTGNLINQNTIPYVDKDLRLEALQ